MIRQPHSQIDFDWKFRLRISVAPICMCLVASLHMTRVFYFNQTPWKGGGFGMFSTVDSVAARFLRVYLVDGEERIPVRIPSWLSQVEMNLRAAPNRAGLNSLAESLAQLNWVEKDHRWRAIAQQRADIRSDETADITIFANLSVTANKQTSCRTNDVIATRDEMSQSLSFDSVQVEVWRYRFVSNTKTLQAEQLMNATGKKDERWLAKAR